MSLKEQQGSAEPASSDLPEELEISFQPEVSGSLFSTHGSLLLRSGRGLPYLMINATLMQGSVPLDYVNYMMIDVRPDESRSFEISLSRRIDLGQDYTCRVNVSGPDGVLASESRQCRAAAASGAEAHDGQSAVGPDDVVLSREELRELELQYIRFGQSLADSSVESSSDEESSSSASGDGSDAAESEASRASEDSAGETSSRDMSSDETSSTEDSSGEGSSTVASSGGALSDEVSSSGASSKSSSQPDVALAVIEEVRQEEENRSEEGEFVASTSSKKYHLPECRYAVKIREENRIYFQSAEDAEDQGYEPCKVCNPG